MLASRLHPKGESFVGGKQLFCKSVIQESDEDITVEEIKMHPRCGDREILNVQRFSRRSTNDKGELEFIFTETASITFSGKVFAQTYPYLKMSI